MTLAFSSCTPADRAAVLAFLEGRLETSMFLLVSLRALGEAAGGPPVAVARDAEGGAVVGVASVTAEGILHVQAPSETGHIAALAVRLASTAISGILGPTEQVDAVLERLALRSAPARMHSEERIYDLDLRNLAPRAPSPGSCVRLASLADVDALTGFRRAYLLEALGAADDAHLDAAARAEAERTSRDGVTFVLVVRGELVAMTRFTARDRAVVQIGGVFTSPALRGRKYGRTVVAGSLAHARAEWQADRAVLFTAESNLPAQRAYEALGFARRGGYCLHFFREPTAVAAAER